MAGLIWLECLLTNRGGACEWMSSEIAWGLRLHFFASGVSWPCLGPLMAPPVWQDEIQILCHSSSCPPQVLSPSSQPLPTVALLCVLKLLCFCLSFPFLDGLPCPLRLRKYQSRAQVKRHLFCDTSSHPTPGSMFSFSGPLGTLFHTSGSNLSPH